MIYLNFGPYILIKCLLLWKVIKIWWKWKTDSRENAYWSSMCFTSPFTFLMRQMQAGVLFPYAGSNERTRMRTRQAKSGSKSSEDLELSSRIISVTMSATSILVCGRACLYQYFETRARTQLSIISATLSIITQMNATANKSINWINKYCKYRAYIDFYDKQGHCTKYKGQWNEQGNTFYVSR